MSYYVGYSQREIYKKRCLELGCGCNSAVVQLLSDVPDEVATLTTLDLSRNFLGSKGVIPLLDVIEGATQLRRLDLQDQQLGNEAVELICARLRRHPSLLKLNLSKNPITLAAASSLLELAKTNTTLQYIGMEHTLVRPSMVTAIEVQLEKNRSLLSAAATTTLRCTSETKKDGPNPTTSVDVATDLLPSLPASVNTQGAVFTTPSGGGASAAAALLRDGAPSITAAPRPSPLRRRCPSHEVTHVFRPYKNTVSDLLFDEDPTHELWNWCEAHQYVFDDDKFNSHNDNVHRIATHTYGIAGWRRIGELFPEATLFGWRETTESTSTSGAGATGASPSTSSRYPRGDGGGYGGEWPTAVQEVAASSVFGSIASGGSSSVASQPWTSASMQLPKEVPDGFSWIFTTFMAGVRQVDALHDLFCCTATGLPYGGDRVQQGTDCPGIYTLRLFVEGQWRFILVDDFLPVDRRGELIFTKPSLNGTSFWPCLLEKMLAKLHEGYHALDAHFQEHHVGVDGPHIRKPIAWSFLSRGTLRRRKCDYAEVESTDATVRDTNNEAYAEVDDASIHEKLAMNCGRVLSRFTSGFYESYKLHPMEETPSAAVFEELHKVLGVPLRNGNARGPSTSVQAGPRRPIPVKRSLVGGHNVSFDYLGGVSGRSCTFTAAVAFSKSSAHTFGGIKPHCAYQIQRVCHSGGVRLLELCNPWCGTEKWTGDWADDSPLWKRHPEVADILMARNRSGRRTLNDESGVLLRSEVALALATKSSRKRSLLTAYSESLAPFRNASFSAQMGSAVASGGLSLSAGLRLHRHTFWISYTDFLQNFEWIHICRVFGDEFHRQEIRGAWSLDNAGGNTQEPTWYTNPHYRLALPHRTYLQVQLTRRDTTLRCWRGATRVDDAYKDGDGGIGLQLLRDTHYPLHCPPAEVVDGVTGLADASPGESMVNTTLNDGSVNGGAEERLAGKESAGTGTAHTLFTSVLFSDVRRSGQRIAMNVMLDPGTNYWIVPTSCAPRVLDDFNVSIVSTSPFALQEAHVGEYWDEQASPAELLTSASVDANYVGHNEGEVAIIFDAQSRVANDANLLLQNSKQKRGRRTYPDLNEQSLMSSFASVCGAPCRLAVAAIASPVASEETVNSCRTEEMYVVGQPGVRTCDAHGSATALDLALVRGEVDEEGRPTRSIGRVEPHAANTFQFDHHTVMEAIVYPDSVDQLLHYTAIGAMSFPGARAVVQYRVWCAAPLLEVKLLPIWPQQELTVCWDSERGSGNYYEGIGHPQIELTRLQPHQRFAVSVTMIEYDTIEPSIMFTVMRNVRHKGEPFDGRFSSGDLWMQSDYVNGSFLQSCFALDAVVPESMVLIPCLQPTGLRGKALVVISSDKPSFSAFVLRGAVR